jgi:hypothetical protein
MKCNPKRAPTKAGLDADKLINIGMCIAILAQHRFEGYGRIRARRMYRNMLHVIREELTPRAPRYTKQYADDLDYTLARLTEAVEKILGPVDGQDLIGGL